MATKKKAPRRAARVPLGTKVTPSRAAGRSTFEDLLATAGALLSEVGFEGLSTNLICKRAGVTPPALYRYFPNKYAVLQELGRRLMAAQDKVVYDWMASGGIQADTAAKIFASNKRLQSQINAATRRQPGNIWILRAMRAVPMLGEVRLKSVDEVSKAVMRALRVRYPGLSSKRLLAATRLSTSVMYAATEMSIESPSQEAQITEEVCWMVSLYYDQLANR
jgi:AcrR family transcriptional regulator